ncbi:AEC family transporter [Falsiroseomonas bella]|nr:AEC family transporter [Falsiroseomonas bella]
MTPSAIAPVLAAVVPVLVTIAIGFFWVRSGRSLENKSLTPLVVSIGTPCLILATFIRTEISPASFATMALATVVAILAFAVVAFVVLQVLGLRVRTYLPSLTFPNNGNLGLPLAAYAFGSEGLGYAIVFYAICMVGQFTVGEAVAAGRSNWSAVLQLPLIYATALGAAVSFLGAAPPAWITNTITLIGGMTIPLMLLMLGASLARIRVRSLGRAAMLSAVRIVPGAAVGYGVAVLLGLHDAAKAVLIMQCAMPVAVYNYLFAQKWNNEPEEVAGLVVTSTLASIVSVPALLWFLSP